MFAAIQRLLAPPVFENDEDKTRLASVLNTIQLSLIVVAFVFTILGLAVFRNFIATIALIAMVIFRVVGWRLVNRGYVRLVAWILVLLLWLGFAGLTVASGGISSPHFFNFITAILIAGFLLGGRAAATVAGLSILAGLGLIIADSYNLLDLAPLPVSPFSTWAAVSANFIVTAVMLYTWNRSLARAIASSRGYASELEDSRQRLEYAIEARTRDLARRSAQLETAAQVAREAAAILDVRQLLSRTVHLVSERFGFYHVGIFLLDENNEFAVLRAANSEGGQRMLSRRHKLRIGEVGIVGNVAATGQPRIALSVGEDAVYFDNPDLPNTQSEMALPLKVRGRVIGALDVQSTETQAFTEEDVSVLQTVADEVALALENARLLVEAQDRLRETNILLGQQSTQAWTSLSSQRTNWGYIFDGVEVLASEEFTARSESDLTVPLTVRQQEIGRITLSLGKRSPTPDELDLARAIAEQASLALENSRLFQETQRALGESEILYRASAGLSSAQTYSDVLEVLRQHTLLGRSDRCAITRFNRPWSGDYAPDWVELISVWDKSEEPMLPPGMRFELSMFPAIEQLPGDNPVVVIRDVENDPRLDTQTRLSYLRGMGARAVLLIPMSIGGSTFGWIGGLYEQPTTYPKNDLRLLVSLSGQAAVTVQSIRLLEDTRRQAERERVMAEITSQVRASTEVDTILRTAIRELGRALRATDGLIRLEVDGDGNGATTQAVTTANDLSAKDGDSND